MESPDFYGCIYQARQLKEGRFKESELIVIHENTDILRFCASPQSENELMLLSIQLHKFTDTQLLPGEHLWYRKIHDILNCNEESMQNNLLPLLSYIFLGLFLDFPRLESNFPASDMDEWQKLGKEVGIVGSTKYKRICNSLFYAMCSFFLSTHKGASRDMVNEDRNREFPKILAQAQEEVLLIIEPTGAHHFMKFLASIRPYNDERALTISYSSSVGEFWRIASYSPFVSLKKTRESRIWKLNSSDRFYLLTCILQFGYVVKIHPSLIEVRLHMDNVMCDVFPYKARIPKGDAPDEQHFPAKICLTIGPEKGHGVQSLSLGVSSANPVTDIGEENTWETTIQPPKTLGFKFSKASTSTKRIKNWGFELSPVDSTHAKMDWTLHDDNTGKPIYDSVPSKSPFHRHKTPSINGALTKQGGVVFAKDDYGKPMTWRLKRDLEGQTLKWIVEASIWLTCKPNNRYSETLNHNFRLVVDLKLEVTSTPN